MLDREAKIGFVRLSQFSRTSHAEMRKAIDELLAKGMSSLIIDLRGNGGGFLDQAILIVNDLLPSGKLIVYTEDRQRRQQREYSKDGKYPELDVVVLVEQNFGITLSAPDFIGVVTFENFYDLLDRKLNE